MPFYKVWSPSRQVETDVDPIYTSSVADAAEFGAALAYADWAKGALSIILHVRVIGHETVFCAAVLVGQAPEFTCCSATPVA